MRYSGIIILGLLLLAGCKTTSVTTSKPTAYSESLANLRPDLYSEASEEPEKPVAAEANEVAFTQHLKTELDSVNQLIIEKNKGQRYVDGYTIQIYTGNNRAEADSARVQAIRLEPTLNPKITYYQPSYKVKTGQFYDRLKAHEMFIFIKEEFPRALLIPERIKIDYD